MARSKLISKEKEHLLKKIKKLRKKVNVDRKTETDENIVVQELYDEGKGKEKVAFKRAQGEIKVKELPDVSVEKDESDEENGLGVRGAWSDDSSSDDDVQNNRVAIAEMDELEEGKYKEKLKAKRLKDAMQMNDVDSSTSDEDEDEMEETPGVPLEQASISEDEEIKMALDLADELKQKIQILRTEISPLMSKVKLDVYGTEMGISYLETKYHLMLSYCINIVFLLMMKCSGKNIRDHPVIEQLVEQRVLLEKIRPIDTRMKSQIDKLLNLAKSDAISSLPVENDTSSKQKQEVEQSESDSDESMDVEVNEAKPNLGDFDVSSSDTESSEDEEREEKAGAYVPKKLVATEHFVDEKQPKRSAYQKQKERLKKRIAQSGILDDLVEAYGDKPIERQSVGTVSSKGLQKAKRFAQDLEEYESGHLKRLQLSKKQKQLLREAEEENTLRDDLADLEAFSDIIQIEKLQEEKNRILSMQTEGNDQETLATLNEFHGEKKTLKRKRKDDTQSIKRRRLSEDAKLNTEEKLDHREISSKMLKNRGLRVQSKKETRNSRVRIKKKYKEKSGRHKKMLQQMKDMKGRS